MLVHWNAITNLAPATSAWFWLRGTGEVAYSAKAAASIRIPHVANPKGRHIEARFPDPLMNPYLGFFPP
jgi:glutamine synthetase